MVGGRERGREEGGSEGGREGREGGEGMGGEDTPSSIYRGRRLQICAP